MSDIETIIKKYFPQTKQADWAEQDGSYYHRDSDISPQVQFLRSIAGPGTVAYGPATIKGTVLRGPVEVAGNIYVSRSFIDEHAKVKGSVQIKSSVVAGWSTVEEFALVEDSRIEKKAYVGGQSTVKNAIITGSCHVVGHAYVMGGTWDKGSPFGVRFGVVHVAHAGPNLAYINGLTGIPGEVLKALPTKGPELLGFSLSDLEFAEMLVKIVKEIDDGKAQ